MNAPETGYQLQGTPKMAGGGRKASVFDCHRESLIIFDPVHRPAIKVSRTWEWSPKTDTVSYEGKDKEGNPVKASYQRSQLSSQSDAIKRDIDPAFAITQYWLLLPFHIEWDGATVIDEGKQKLPLGDGFADRVVAEYPSEGGYQPGDTWDLYVGADKRIEDVRRETSPRLDFGCVG